MGSDLPLSPEETPNISVTGSKCMHSILIGDWNLKATKYGADGNWVLMDIGRAEVSVGQRTGSERTLSASQGQVEEEVEWSHKAALLSGGPLSSPFLAALSVLWHPKSNSASKPVATAET